MKTTSSFPLVLLVLLLSLTTPAISKSNLPPSSDLRIGIKHRPPSCPRRTKSGDTITLHYTGTLHKNAKLFDSSRDRDDPFKFVLGAGEVIQGWESGLLNMCVDEKRRLVIPSGLGYGEVGAGIVIGADDTLAFDVELLKIEE